MFALCGFSEWCFIHYYLVLLVRLFWFSNIWYVVYCIRVLIPWFSIYFLMYYYYYYYPFFFISIRFSSFSSSYFSLSLFSHQYYLVVFWKVQETSFFTSSGFFSVFLPFSTLLLYGWIRSFNGSPVSQVSFPGFLGKFQELQQWFISLSPSYFTVFKVVWIGLGYVWLG